MIVIDTSVLVDALTGAEKSAPAMRAAFRSDEQVYLPALVLYEWLRGPRRHEELSAVDQLFPPELIIPFHVEEATVGALIYRGVRRARTREVDIAIAACAIVREAELWTLNLADFQDIPGLRLYTPDSSQ